MTTSPSTLDFNEHFTRAYDLMKNSRQNLFITGKAGTGKSTLLQYFRTHTDKNIVVLAPTGVAAVNVKGQTIHSFFNFKPGITPETVDSIRVRKTKRKIYQKLETIVIDEISMVRADLLDSVDAFLRLHGPDESSAFGGIQMIFIGDLYQLSPVVTSAEKAVFNGKRNSNGKAIYQSPYFFDAKIFENLRVELIELEKIYRQKDDRFVALLNAVRNNSVTEDHLTLLNQRHLPDFNPDQSDFYIHLTTTNDLADQLNQEQLNALKGKAYRYQGELTGDFDVKSLPTQEVLDLKAGAQVMLLNNDPQGRWVNGTIGKISSIEKGSGMQDTVRVELSAGNAVAVTPFSWEMFRFFYNEETQTLDSESIGSFTQYPLRLAWAVTIHKSQGKTFEKVIIDIGHGTFSHGQVYVALSRCTNLEGIVLKKPILKKHIFMDWRIVQFTTAYQYRHAETQCPLNEKRKILEQAVKNKHLMDIVYLKSGDEKSRRSILPKRIGRMEYQGKTYLGLEAYCFNRKDTRVFRVDRILEIKESVPDSL